jgi:hypothetical protein
MVTAEGISTGLPFSIAGDQCHVLAHPTALASRTALPLDLVTTTFVTFPSAVTRKERSAEVSPNVSTNLGSNFMHAFETVDACPGIT